MYNVDGRFLTDRVRVLLLGVGGSGSHMARELIQLDTTLRQIDHQGLDVTIADGSGVTEANLTRQAFFPTQCGMNKASATVWTANNLYGKDFTAIAENITPTKDSIKDYDLIITAVDKPSVRYALSQLCFATNKLWLDLGNDNRSGNVCLGEIGINRRLPNVCDFWDYRELSDDDANIKSCSAAESLQRQQLGVNQFAARIGAQLLWQLFRTGKVQNHGAMFDVNDLTVHPIKVDKQVWLTFGINVNSL